MREVLRGVYSVDSDSRRQFSTLVGKVGCSNKWTLEQSRVTVKVAEGSGRDRPTVAVKILVAHFTVAQLN